MSEPASNLIPFTGKPGKTMQIAIRDLALHPDNVRKTAGNPEGFKALVDSIDAAGLLQNLVATSDVPEGKYLVFSGGRRLMALRWLVEAGKMKDTDTVTVQVRDVSSVELLSTMENDNREPLPPIDRFEAYGKMAKRGMVAHDIAAAMGTTERDVKGLLALSALHPSLIAAYKEGETTLEVLQALTLSDDHELQLAAFQTNEHSAWRIRQLLNEKRISTTDGTARLIDLDAYRERGGVVIQNLFGTEEYLADVKLAQDMAGEALITAREALVTEGWSNVRVEADSSRARKYLEVCGWQRPTKSDADPDLEERLKAAEAHLQSLHENDEIDLDEFERLESEASDLVDDLQAELRAQSEAYSDAQKEKGVALLYVDQYSGRIVIERGLLEKVASTEPDPDAEPSASIPDSALKETGTPRPAISDTLMRRLTGEKHQRFQLELMENHEHAAKLGQFLMIIRAIKPELANTEFYNQHKRNDHLVRWEQPNEGKARDAIKKIGKALPSEITKGSVTERWRYFQGLSLEARNALHAFALASLTVDPGLDDGLYNVVYRELDIKLETTWRPTADNFFRHVGTKEQLLKMGEKIAGKTWAIKNEKTKKGVLASELEALCADPNNTWLPKELKA